jgi:hypothetical protein
MNKNWSWELDVSSSGLDLLMRFFLEMKFSVM